MYKILLNLIILLHALLVLFIVIVPFTNIPYLLLLHVIIIPFILLHWVLNNNVCALTLAEFKIREYINGGPVDRNQCFMARLMDPIYDFKKNNNNRRFFLYTSMILLWSLSCYKLYSMKVSGQIKTIMDLISY